MREQNTAAQEKKKNHKMKPIPCIPPSQPHTNINQPPLHLSHPPIIYNNNTMDMEFLVQIRQTNKCGSVRNDEIIHLGSLVQALGSASSASCKIPATFIDSICPNNHSTKQENIEPVNFS